MSRDVGDAIGEALGRVAREAAQSLSTNAHKASNGHFSGPKGFAAGAGLAALAPLAVKGAGKLANSGSGTGEGPMRKVRAKAREAVTGTVKDAVGKKVDDAGGVGGVAKQAGKDMLPGVGSKSGDDNGKSGGGGKSGGTDGVPKGRKMPVQQSVDIALPLQDVYNAWTQFEEWPQFMHRLDRVTQEDDSHVSFKTKIWGKSKEFKAEIVEQRPDDRIKWQVTEGVTHTGVVSFHELSDRLTRVDVDVSVNPGSLIEKAARGMRHIKRAVRADLARFKAHVEIDDLEETGEWRGVIEDGDVKSSAAAGSSGRRSRPVDGSRPAARRRPRVAAAVRARRAAAAGPPRAAAAAARPPPAAVVARLRAASAAASSSGSKRGRSSSGSGASSRGGSTRSGSSSNGSSRSSSNRAKASSNGRSGSGSSRRQKASSRS